MENSWWFPWVRDAGGEGGGAQVCRVRKGVEGLLQWWAALYLDYDGDHTNLLMINLYRTEYTYTNEHSKTGEVWPRSVDCINVNILLCDMAYSSTKCYHWRKLGKGTQDLCVLLFKTTCEPTVISIKISMKNIIWFIMVSLSTFSQVLWT